MPIQVSHDNQICIVQVEGRIDILSSEELQKILTQQISAGDHRVILDLAAMDYISSAGLRVLLDARKQLKKVGGTLVLSGVTDFVQKILTSTGFNNLFTQFATPEEALDSFK